MRRITLWEYKSAQFGMNGIRRESEHESRTCRCGRSKVIVTFSDARLSSRHSAVFSGVKIDWNSSQPRTVDGCLID
jgi:hypothetical protein